MRHVVFDIETDGLLDECTKLHSIVCLDAKTGELASFADQPGYRPLADGIRLLSNARTLIGHNIIAFDIPALEKLTGFSTKAKTYDTLIAARTAYPDVMIFDIHQEKIPGELYGRHSLKAWGMRLDLHKDEYGESEEDVWDEWNQQMQEYCEQDVRVTAKLFEFLKAENIPNEALAIEHRLAHYLFAQERNGFPFKVKEAEELNAFLEKEESRLLLELQGYFGKWVKRDGYVMPKVNRGRIGDKKSTMFRIKKGCSYCKLEINDYTGGPHQTKAALKRVYGWVPNIVKKRKRIKGEMVVVEEEEGTDEAVLSKLSYPCIETLIQYNAAKKVRGMLSNGDNAWLRLVDEHGRIHGRVNQNGTVTHRATHSRPNISQVPSERKPYGKEVRQLFYAPEGWKLVGTDASGLELRMLAHYMHEYDNGAYGHEILSGDIHTANQEAAGLEERSQAKTFIYGFLYGAGAVKLGSIVNPSGSERQQAIEGKQLKERFLANTPALSLLIDKVIAEAEKGWITTIDGRKVYVKSQHKALNCLLQSSGSIFVKKWITLFYQELIDKLGVPSWDGRWTPCSFSHDDVVLAVREKDVDVVQEIVLRNIGVAGESMNCNIRMDGESKVGQTWLDVH